MLGLGLGLTRGTFGSASSGAVAPSNTVPPVATIPYAIQGQTFSTTNGTWSGDLPISYTYQWESSADGLTGWGDVVGATSSTYTIPTGAAQLLFYRCKVTATNIAGFASAYSNVIGGVDSQANTHFNRVTADSGVMTYGLIGVDTYTKTLKYIYNVSDITTKFAYVRHLDYIGYKLGLGTGSTEGRAVQTVYSLTGVNYDLRQTSVSAQPALGAWNQRNFVSGYASSGSRLIQSTAKANTNNTKLTVIIEAYRANTQFGVLIAHGSNWRIDMTGGRAPRFYFSDGTASSATTGFTSTGLNGYLRLIVTTSGSDLILNWATSTDGTNWTAFGSQVTATGKAGLIGSSSQPLDVGGLNIAGVGDYYQAQVFDSTDTLIFNMQPSTYNRAVNVNSFVASTGETYTIQNGTTATGLKNMICDQTMIQGNGNGFEMKANSATLNTLQFTQYNVFRKFLNTTALGSFGVFYEFGEYIGGHGIGYVLNEIASTEALFTNSNVGLNGTSWQASNTNLKFTTFRGNIADTREQSLATNNTNNTFNADQSTANNTTAIVATGDKILAKDNTLWVNAIVVANHLSLSTDSGTEETNMYNYIADLTNII